MNPHLVLQLRNSVNVLVSKYRIDSIKTKIVKLDYQVGRAPLISDLYSILLLRTDVLSPPHVSFFVAESFL